VRRAKLYYLRDRVGKAARVREQRYSGPEEAVEPGLVHEPTPEEELVAEAAEDATMSDGQGTIDEAPVDEAVTEEDAPTEEAAADEAPAEPEEAASEEPAAEEAPEAEAAADPDAEAAEPADEQA